MRLTWIFASLLCGIAPAALFGQLPAQPSQLVREVVYNELHDHQNHGYWRYWIEKGAGRQSRVDDQVETPEGPVAHTILRNGRPLDRDSQQAEQQKIERLLRSPAEQARHRSSYAEDERRIGNIVALLPEAFAYEYAGEQNGLVRLRFQPNRNRSPRSVEERIFHAMSGELWVDARAKRLARLEGRLIENVDFGYGLLGRLYKGGWFLLERSPASAADWKTSHLEVHMQGKALLLKTISRETSERRGGFVAVPAALSLPQAAALLESSELPNPPIENAAYTAHQ
jgi:hypothetical protein